MQATEPAALRILDYWFGSIEDTSAYFDQRVALWFGGAQETDASIRREFEELATAAAEGKLAAWQRDPWSCLALVILLDQFPMNMHRGQARAFTQSALALPVALHAIDEGFDLRVAPIQRVFYYLPLEHAEDLEMQKRSVGLHDRLLSSVPPPLQRRMDGFRDYAIKHLDVIRRFGRFPDRNAALGREPTPEERRYLEAGGPPF